MGIDNSLEGKRWLMRSIDDRLSLAMAQRLMIPDIVARVMAGRDITLDGANAFLNPTLRELLPNPSQLSDMDRAAERVASAIIQSEKIGIFGDYDVDGATSSALLGRFISAVGGQWQVHIPDRLKEGYGPNTPALLAMAANGVSIVLTVDCGTAAFDPIAEAGAAGLDVIVVDHHTAEPKLPSAFAVVNPNRLDDESGEGRLAAVGVAFLLAIAINRVLRDKGWYGERSEPNLMQWLDLVALGTVCDVVPLSGLNRALVTQGLKVMAGRGNPGIAALADVGGVDETPGAYHLGFIMGPRVNAGGRVGTPDLGSRLLATNDHAEAKDIAIRLDALNRERRDIEQAVLDQALDQMTDDPDAAGAVAFVSGQGWHPGVVGIVASRLKDRYNRPACVLAMDDKGALATGSGRSVTGVDLGAAVIAAHQAGIIEKGGGHKMAAGFTVRCDRLNTFRAFLNERIGTHIAEAGIVPTLKLDGSLTTAGADLQTAEKLQQLSPFGSGNAEPRFVVTSANVVYADRVGENHVRCTLESADGGRLAGICFRCTDRPLGQALLEANGRPMHVAGRLRVNTWQGRSSAQLMIDDAAPLW
ncbi:MAG: single-stranded-DNA-specific exonuclease RecJ [Rhodospirillaceae bacterium]|nr:single-stranded-DNA-specific exonuclease RecJ [Rhodospirillaceae bacterium]